jgi:hypothetical protein
MGFVKKSYLTHHMTRLHPDYMAEQENTTAPKETATNSHVTGDYAYEEVFADNC